MFKEPSSGSRELRKERVADLVTLVAADAEPDAHADAAVAAADANVEAQAALDAAEDLPGSDQDSAAMEQRTSHCLPAWLK